MDQLSRTDALTGLYNRRHLDEELAADTEKPAATTTRSAVVMLDIDHFKHVNDIDGHPGGR